VCSDMSTHDIAAGEEIFRLGTRLAIADHPAPEGEVDSDDRPWSVRLAARLLEMADQGAACPWQPYLAVRRRLNVLDNAANKMRCCAVRLGETKVQSCSPHAVARCASCYGGRARPNDRLQSSPLVTCVSAADRSCPKSCLPR
jgi:hypothetical protein